MYSDLKNIQILLSLLKAYNIKNMVLSPGSRNIPFVHSVEEDEFFHCYSIVDERSASFFALGLVQNMQCPVVINCTSGTAAANYVSAVSEAYYQKLPLIVITADRNPYYLDQQEDQMIPQMGLFDNLCKKAVQLPIVKDDTDYWACCRMINEALLELDHHGRGPVHINVPIEDKLYSFNTPRLPKTRNIIRLTPEQNEKKWNEKITQLQNTQKILIIYGQSPPLCPESKQIINSFSKKYNCAISTDHLSNFGSNKTIDAYYFSKLNDITKNHALLPEIVITVNGNSLSPLKYQLKNVHGQFEHWCVSEDGKLTDPFRNLTNIFECSSEYFFKYFMERSDHNIAHNTYFKAWENEISNIPLPDELEIPFSEFYSVQQFMKLIPKASLLYLANGNSVRLAQYFDKDESIIVNCHRGTNGIDGTFSSFVGNAYVNENLSFLLIGDLSFFYDSNAIWNKYVSKNIRILLNNNGGTSVIQYPVMGKKNININSFNRHSAAKHNTSAKGWAESQGLKYLRASNKIELLSVLPIFISQDSSKPILLEVFSDKDADVEIQHSVDRTNYWNQKPYESLLESGKESAKGIIKKLVPSKIKKLIRGDY